MKILCKVKPDYNVCCNCIDDQENRIKPKLECKDCLSRIPECEILHFDNGLLRGSYALVLMNDGKIEDIPLNRIFDVRTEHNAMDGFQRGFRAMAKAVDDYAKHQMFEEFKED